jgi:Protein of unknown function (DUF4449)
VPNFYKRYANAAQKQMMQGKKKIDKKEIGDKKVNIAMTKHDSIFPNLNLPGGISTKATEYKELGMRGEKWESPVFKLGSAPQSTDIAHAPQVTRKSHAVTQGGVRGPSNVPGGAASQTGGQYDTTGAQGSAGYGQAGTAFIQPSTTYTEAGPGATVVTPGATIPTTASTVPAIGATSGHTLLGEHNPVFTGDA